jgi:putative Ca2+/H+ antiporter (TMEM165/GDT1 family)
MALVLICLCPFLFQSVHSQHVNLTIVSGTQASSSLDHLADFLMREDVVTAFTSSFVMVLTSEPGDKTFFIAAIMAMSHGRLPVFVGAYASLAVATVLSALLGSSLQRLPHIVTHVISIVLFIFFGLKMLKEAYDYEPTATYDGLEEVGNEINAKNSKKQEPTKGETDLESGSPSSSSASSSTSWISPVILQAFTMTSVAECGDRSQIATVVLATTKNVVGVTLGGLIGHFICTAMAVIGGKLLASRISERTIWLCGGCFYLFFAAWTFFHPED